MIFGKPLLLFDNMLSDSAAIVTVSPGTAAGDYAVANLSDFRSYTWWLASGAGTYYIDIENGANRAADYIYIAGDAFVNATVKVWSWAAGNTNAINHVNVFLNGETELFVPFTTTSRPHWRVEVTTTMPTALAHVMVGNKLELPRYLQRGFDPLGSKPRGRLSVSSKGQPLGVAESWREWRQKIILKNIDANWLRSTWQPAFDSHLKHTPSVFVWDPVAHATELYFVHPVFQYAAPQLAGQFANLIFTLEGLA